MTQTVAPSGSIQNGSTIVLEYQPNKASETYRIARKNGRNKPKRGIIGPDSDWGLRLIGKKVGDIVELSAPEENVVTTRITSVI